ncbi:hypothetical protein [Terrimicrobium sacchariphilum]|nr:hypothetical protein [Terrimicrobium sacchariphilum]
MGSPPDTSRRTLGTLLRWDIGGLAAVLFMLCVAASCRAEDKSRNLGDFVLGFNTHKVLANDQPLLEGVGIWSLRVDLYRNPVSDDHGAVNTEHPVFPAIANTPEAYHQPLVILGYGHRAFQNSGRPSTPESRRAFVDYALAGVGRLHERTRFFEVWNEWNVPGMGRTPLEEGTGRVEDYVTLLRETYTALKKQFPDLFILGGATGGIGADEGYMVKAVNLGMLQWLDGLSIHPYFYGADGEKRLPEIAIATRLGQLHDWLRADSVHGDVPLYVTELGWPTYGEPHGVSYEEQACFMVRSILLFACEPQVKGVWLYEFRDGGTDPKDREHHFGVVKADGTPKPAFHALRSLIPLLRDARSLRRVANSAKDRVVTMVLTMKDGADIWAVWSVFPGEEWVMENKGGRMIPVPFSLSGSRDVGINSLTSRFVVGNEPFFLRSSRAGDGGIDAVEVHQ